MERPTNNKILVVDDASLIRKFLTRQLSAAGYEVSAAGDGIEGYETAKSVAPALIISDLMMPGGDGMQFLQKVRADEGMKDISFILLTSQESLQTKIDLLTVGADDYLSKSTDAGELLARVKTNMRVSNLNREVREKNRELEESYDKLKKAQAHMLQHEKMASVGQLAAGVAHEINNPTGFVLSNLTTLQKFVGRTVRFLQMQSDTIKRLSGDAWADMEAEKKSVKLDYIIDDMDSLIAESIDGANRVKDIVLNLTGFAHVSTGRRTMSNINTELDSAIKMALHTLEYKYNAEIIKEFGDIPETMANHGELNQVYMNIMINAACALEGGGMVTVRTWHENSDIFVSVADTGCGIPDNIKDKLFDPFFTTKDIGKGTGLGLSVSYDIVARHNGEITVESAVGGGAVFTVRIPVVN